MRLGKRLFSWFLGFACLLTGVLTVPSLLMAQNADWLWSDKVAWARTAPEYFVAPNGLSTNDGTEASPWDIESVFDGQQVIPDGSIVWLRGGTYGTGGDTLFIVNLQSANPDRPIIFRQYPVALHKIFMARKKHVCLRMFKAEVAFHMKTI